MDPRARAVPLLLATLLALALAPRPAAGKAHGAAGTVVLDGQVTEVRWTDGDSFKVLSGPLQGFGTRLQGYNTLETFGPVHRIGTLGPAELETIARSSAPLLAGTAWRCT